MKKSSLHNYLLTQLETQKEMGLDSQNSFVFEQFTFCHNSTVTLFSVTEYMVKKVVDEHLRGHIRFHHGNEGNLYFSERQNTAISFIKNFARCHCENLPDRQIMRLPSYLNVKAIYVNYTENIPAGIQLKERSFSHVFQTVFGDVYREQLGQPRITFLPRHSHPICVECDRLSTMCKNVKTESDRNYAEKRKRAHMLEIRQKYLLCCENKELSKRFPEDYLYLSFDDIDQSKIKSPYNLQNTKDISGMLRLNNHCTGMIVTNGKLFGDRTVLAYLNNNQFQQDSNKTVSILFDVLIFVQEKLEKLPKRLFVETDNCSRDLKNQFVLSFYWILVDIGIFEEIIVSHMPVGHTHGEVDQAFSIFASHLKKQELPTFETLLIELGKIKIKGVPIVVKEMEFISDYVKKISPYLLNIEGHTSFFQFKFRRENEKTRMYVKADLLDKVWQFGEGIKLFETCPDLKNLQVASFRTESEYGEIFKSVWTKYIPSLTGKFNEDQIMNIKNAWECRISRLIALKESEFKAFDMSELVPIDTNVEIPSITLEDMQAKEPALTATFYPVEIKDFSISDLQKDCSIVFYTRSKSSRPWIGLFVEFGHGSSRKVKVQWLKKDKKYWTLDTAADGSPYYSELELESVLFSGVLRNVSYRGGRGGPYLLDRETKKQISDAYLERDDCLVE